MQEDTRYKSGDEQQIKWKIIFKITDCKNYCKKQHNFAYQIEFRLKNYFQIKNILKLINLFCESFNLTFLCNLSIKISNLSNF